MGHETLVAWGPQVRGCGLKGVTWPKADSTQPDWTVDQRIQAGGEGEPSSEPAILPTGLEGQPLSISPEVPLKLGAEEAAASYFPFGVELSYYCPQGSSFILHVRVRVDTTVPSQNCARDSPGCFLGNLSV